MRTIGEGVALVVAVLGGGVVVVGVVASVPATWAAVTVSGAEMVPPEVAPVTGVGRVPPGTVLGTVSGLIIAASGAVAHEIMTNYMKRDLNDHDKVRAGKVAAVVVGILAMVLGIVFKSVNV